MYFIASSSATCFHLNHTQNSESIIKHYPLLSWKSKHIFLNIILSTYNHNARRTESKMNVQHAHASIKTYVRISPDTAPNHSLHQSIKSPVPGINQMAWHYEKGEDPFLHTCSFLHRLYVRWGHASVEKRASRATTESSSKPGRYWYFIMSELELLKIKFWTIFRGH